jgi:RNA polymerase sigma-70 factor (ECF subfamily)
MLAHRCIVDELRRLAVRRDVPVEHLPEEAVAFDPLPSGITQLSHALPEELRTTLLLSAVMGFRYEEIAEILNCPIGTVRSRLHAARGRMAKLIEEHEQRDEERERRERRSLS